MMGIMHFLENTCNKTIQRRICKTVNKHCVFFDIELIICLQKEINLIVLAINFYDGGKFL